MGKKHFNWNKFETMTWDSALIVGGGVGTGLVVAG